MGIDKSFVTMVLKTRNTEQDVQTNETEPMLHSNVESELSSDRISPCGIRCEKYSSAIKLFRVTALVLCLITKIIKQKIKTESISSEELVHAEYSWLLRAQKRDIRMCSNR